MRACIATSEYHLGGETFINRHIAELFGGQTVVVCGRFNGANPYEKPVFARRGRRLHPSDAVVAPYWLLRNRLVHATSRLPFGSAKRDLAAFLRAHDVRVILAEFGTQALAVAPLGQELDLPVFTYFRGTDASKALGDRRIVEAYRRMMPRLAGVFAVSQFLLDNLARHGVTHPAARVIPSGVDVRRFKPGEKRPLSCLAVGRFVEKKAPDTTLRAFAEATRDLPEARLDFVGDGPLLARCRAAADELGVADRVAFLGAQPHERVRDLLAGAQFFLQHSVTDRQGNTEGLPTAIQEAMAAGCVVVSTRHAGIPEAVVEGETGYLVEEHDAAGFADAIRAALTQADPGAMGETARARAEARFDNARLLAELEAALLAAMRR
ncbi:glycosyl transferase family 1 [Rhodosalinus halophilus]|uniref:Glycosyl transferase family 1 n=1 Tax=Rhodosalinus halophilus TaxID=2259333 RepID=A0A365U6L2_9RHOB|nr:glycosyltransferase family 4 protein [Rhodosalinus halophilus]RBI83355.1 glycosyl transferase family 1 [Rhodosalinus halophilus]